MKPVSLFNLLQTQLISGVWTEKVLEYSTTGSIKEFMSLASTIALVNKIALMKVTKDNSDKVLFTLAGLKLLKENYEKDEAKWTMIAKKSRKALEN